MSHVTCKKEDKCFIPWSAKILYTGISVSVHTEVLKAVLNEVTGLKNTSSILIIKQSACNLNPACNFGDQTFVP